jgi:hypothetical protein
VPNSVPTPSIEGLFRIASLAVSGRRNPLKASKQWEWRATSVPSAKLLILCRFMPPEQKVSGSNPLGHTNLQ